MRPSRFRELEGFFLFGANKQALEMESNSAGRSDWTEELDLGLLSDSVWE